MFRHCQSAYRIARSTLDPLARLVADINNGFNEQPPHRTIAVQLDLTSAFNKVEHLGLLAIMDELGIPACFGRFYRGFLAGRTFRVRYNNTVSRPARESCGSPQGTVSSPWLFLIYMEAMLREIEPEALLRDIATGMFADDLTLWATGRDVPPLEQKLTQLIAIISAWNERHNMKFSDKIGKCKALLFTNNMRNKAVPRVLLDGKPLQAVTKTTLLGVVLDQHLTMKYHFEKLNREGRARMKQLCAVANTSFGPSQLSLRNMFVAYVRSVFDYAAPVWYPLMSLTHFDKLQRLQNKCIRVILGVPTSTRIQDLHLESNLQPLSARCDAATAYQAEKYRRHSPDDPLYVLAHQDPPTRLRSRTWQHYSSEILTRAGIDPCNTPCLPCLPQHQLLTNSVAPASQLPSSAEPEPESPLRFIMGNRLIFQTIPR